MAESDNAQRVAHVIRLGGIGVIMMTKFAKLPVLLGLSFVLVCTPVLADRLKDMTSIAGVRSNQLVGYGVVVGLA